MAEKFLSIKRDSSTVGPDIGTATIYSEFGTLKFWPYGGESKDILLDGYNDCFDGEPANYVAPVPSAPTAASYAAEFVGNDNNLTFTAVEAGTAGNNLVITLLDPNEDSSPFSLAIDGENPLKVLVYLATDDGDAGVATLPTDTEGESIAVTLDTDGAAAADGKTVDTVLDTILDPWGNEFPEPSNTLSAAVVGDAFVVSLSTGAGTPGVLALIEDSGSLGSIQIVQKAAFAGAWGNGTVRARVLITQAPNSGQTCVASLEETTLDITYYLPSDLDGLPVAESDDDMATAINAELLAQGLDGFIEAQSQTAGDFDTATEDWVVMGVAGGGTDGVDAEAAGTDTAENVALAIAALDGIASAVATTPADTVSLPDVSVMFADGGANYAFTTTAADIVSAFTNPEDPAYNADVAALMTVALTGDDEDAGGGVGFVNVLAEKTFGIDGTAGLDAGDTVAEVNGTPANIGNLAIDENGFVWIAKETDGTVTQDSWEYSVSSADVGKIVKLTQVEYDAIATPDENTLYLIYEPEA